MSSNVLVGQITVYAIYFAYRYFCDFGLGGEICDGLISQFLEICDGLISQFLWCFHTINSHIYWNKTTTKITMYTVHFIVYIHSTKKESEHFLYFNYIIY